MSSKRAAGFTLIEMIIAMVVISVGLAGVLSAFNAVVRTSSDPLVQKQLLALADEMMEEVMLKPYAAAGAGGAIVGCNRSAADEIADYNNYTDATATNQAPCAIDGTRLFPALAGYVTTVTVTPTALGAIPAGSASQIVVTVTHGAQTVVLTGWRTNYGAGLP
jgi:MSHA pilin protein MshD